MTDITLYIGTDININLSITGIGLQDIDDIHLIFSKTNLADVVFKKSDGEILVVGTVVTVVIPDNAFTVAGIYKLKIIVVDTGGNIRGLRPNPDKIKFK